jgi:hypothetical protein
MVLFGIRQAGCRIVDRHERSVGADQIGEVSGAFERGGDGGVFVDRRGGVLTGDGEEDEVLVARLGELGDEGFACNGQPIVIGVIAGFGWAWPRWRKARH